MALTLAARSYVLLPLPFFPPPSDPSSFISSPSPFIAIIACKQMIMVVVWGLGIGLLWHGGRESGCCGMGAGNQATVAWVLGIGLLWHGGWESGYCGMGTGNQAGAGIRLLWYGDWESGYCGGNQRPLHHLYLQGT